MVVPRVWDSQISYSLPGSAGNHQFVPHSSLPPHSLGDIYNEVSSHSCLGRVWPIAFCLQANANIWRHKVWFFNLQLHLGSWNSSPEGLGNDVGELNFIPAPTIWEATTEQCSHSSAKNSPGELLLRQLCCCSSMSWLELPALWLNQLLWPALLHAVGRCSAL